VPGDPINRLPLHLQFALTEPGAYEVRLVHYGDFVRRAGDVRIQSAWLPVDVLPAVPAQRLPIMDRTPAGIVTAYLPDLLARRDDKTLGVLLDYLYHPSPLVSTYAANALAYWPDSLIEMWLADIQRTRGPLPHPAGRITAAASN
jgi:hypothetical protein